MYTLGLTDPSHAIGFAVMDSNPAPIPIWNNPRKKEIKAKDTCLKWTSSETIF